MEDFEDLPSPLGFVQTLQEAGLSKRARAVAADVQRLAPGSVTALTIAAEVARTLDRDARSASALLDEALEADLDPAGVPALAQHLLEADRTIDALALVEEHLFGEPEDEDAQEVQARAFELIYRRAQAGGKLRRREREALSRFSDRELIYRLRDALREYAAERPELEEQIALTVRDWLAELRAAEEDDEFAGALESEEELNARLEERYGGIVRLAIEHAWLLGGDEDEEDDPELEGLGTPLALFAAEPDTSSELARAAWSWLETQSYGLWQVSDPDPTPGLWLTDLVTGIRRYVAIPPEQLEGVSRWSVLLAALVALDGTWRTTGTFMSMRPAEADWAAELAREASADVVRALAGERPRRRAGRRKAPEPHGVLVGEIGPAPPAAADLMSKVLGNLIPAIVGELRQRRAAGPTLTNTDGHSLRLITAEVKVASAAAAGARLAAHPDFEAAEDGELSWWGRELTELERESALALLRSQTSEPVEEPEEAPRWLRGRLRPRKDGLEVEVNSEERLTMLLELLEELGLQPDVTRRSVFDPAEDLPPIRTGGPLPFGASQEAIDAWLSHWPAERVPALGGLTPRAAARRKKKRVRLEALLREFEHDAHLLAQAGRPAPDIGRLRAELGMERWWE